MIKVDDLGQIINDKRMQLGMTLDEVSRATGVGINTISRVENGLGFHSLTYQKLAEWVESHDGD
jgi:transcriptional regulator with XRE-family HTH domain